MRLLTQADIASFLAEKPAAAIHFDANWDAKYRAVTRSAMADAEQVLAGRVNFGEVDCDTDPELAKSIPILNVPSVAYYRNGKLVGALIGAGHDVRLRLECVLRGDTIR
jgi:thioredoxin-like negative regulator of GroEL